MLYANLRDGISIGSEVSIVFVPHDTDVVYVPGYEEKNMYIWLFIGVLISIVGSLLLRHVYKNA